MLINILGRIIKGIKAGPSPVWIVARLKESDTDRQQRRGHNELYPHGDRPPMHAFDLDKIKGNVFSKACDKRRKG
jgi:phenylalanyl-tRNA synthetase beta subunit